MNKENKNAPAPEISMLDVYEKKKISSILQTIRTVNPVYNLERIENRGLIRDDEIENVWNVYPPCQAEKSYFDWQVNNVKLPKITQVNPNANKTDH